MLIQSRIIKSTLRLSIGLVFIMQSSIGSATRAQPTSSSSEQVRYTDPHVQRTHDHARSLAQQQVNKLLMDAILQAYNLNFNDGVSGAKRKEIQSRIRSFQEVNSRLDILSQNHHEFDQYSSDVLLQIVSDFRTAMIELKTEKMFLKDFNVEASSIRNNLIHVYSTMKKNMNSYCTEGIAYSPYSGIMPLMQPLMPAFDINVKLGASFGVEGYKMEDYEVSGKAYTSSQALALLTILDAVSTSIAASVISQQAVFTATTFSSLTASQQAASAFIGLGASLAIAAAVYLYNLEEMRKKKEEFIRDSSRQYDQIARSTDYKNYFKEECAKAFVVLDSLDLSEIAYSNPTKGSMAHFEKEWQEVLSFIAGFRAVAKAYDEKYAELEKGQPANPTEEDKKSFEKKLSEAPETKAYEEYGKSLDSITLSRFFKTIVIKSIQDGFKYAEKMQKMIESDLKSVDEKKLQERYRVLRELVVHKKYAEEIAQKTSSYFDEQSAFLEFRGLYQELTVLIIKKTEHLVTISLSQTEKTLLDTEFKTWMENARKLLRKYPRLTNLDDLIEQAKYFQTMEATTLLR